MTLKKNKAHILCCFKLCASFHSHQSIQIGVTVQKRSIRVKIGNFLSRVTFKFDTWLKNNRAPRLCSFNLCASFQSHGWIQTGVTVRKRPIWVIIDDFFSRVTLKFDGWPWKKNRAPLLNNIKLCVLFHHHMSIQTGVRVGKRPNGVLIPVTFTFDLWPCPFAWSSLLSLVITPENFMMIRWQEHCEKRCNTRADR